MSSRTSTAIQNHPAVSAVRRAYALMTVCGVMFAAWMIFSGSVWLECASPLAVAAACYFGLLFYRAPQQGLATRLHNTALQLVLRGKDEEAIALLDQIPERELRRGAVGVSVHTLRAMIAMHSGEVARALSLTTAGLALPWGRGPFAKPYEELHRTKARSFRAVCQASLGHEADAESDARLAEEASTVTADVLARVSLARSIVLARRNDRSALAAHLQRTAGLMLQWLSPRERSLVRAFRRMARAQTRNVYRESARREEVAGAFASWVGALAPGAEAYAREAPTGAIRSEADRVTQPEEPTPASAISNVRRAHANAGKKMKRVTVGLWVILVGAFFGIYNLFSPTPATHARHAATAVQAPSSGMEFLPGETFVAIFGLLLVFIAVRVRIQRRQARQLLQAELAVARGDLAGATATMGALTKAMAYTVAAGAHLGLARLAERGARWEEALAQCNDGMRRLLQYSTAKAVHADYLLPEMMATRALVLAAMDRQKEAMAEMTVIASDYPAYVGMGAAEFRVQLVSAVRSRDLTAAMRAALTRTPDLTLSIRDDMLADVVLAATTEMTAEERERIEAELSDDAELGGWIDAIAPDLRRRGRVRVEPPKQGASGEALVESAEGDHEVEPRGSRAASLSR